MGKKGGVGKRRDRNGDEDLAKGLPSATDRIISNNTHLLGSVGIQPVAATGRLPIVGTRVGNKLLAG